MKQWMMAGLMLVVGLALAYGGARTVVRAHQSASWPTTDATITSSSVETLRSRRGGVRFHPDVRYQYSVAGTLYSANTISFGGNDAGTLSDAQVVTHHFASGNHVPVHYEPADPSVACLEVGHAGIASYVLALGGLALVAIAGWGIWDMLRAGRREKARRQRPQPA
ncbi:DUF3592 domain-containing protein [Pyxidicoccus parkwayensis]|uniref:DUF3592 domain-containing protein n=1 Tax=Pyxidicoccus parkwayensis TaxID=2813578 RepID=A0ABX7NJ14_9BACT|nr:DUF3592 domain-containing protein [Pyxidicoccus parkwaysis]QSQ18770.1 DUF3592 domain-containing protein [Pyxidicoccus parkwaysis]